MKLISIVCIQTMFMNKTKGGIFRLLCFRQTISPILSSDMGDIATQHHPYRKTIPHIPPRDREINKTIPNRTKSNITKSTELTVWVGGK